MQRPVAWILSIGNELLIGRIVNTNASWLGEKLTLDGFLVRRIITVPDSLEDIAEEVRRAAERARVVITTGGLGPTYDDMTLQGVARAFGLKLVLNPEAKKMVDKFYSSRGLPLTEERLKMAYLPEGSKPIPNPIGAAPGCLLEVGDTLVVSLPGVPSEMKSMFEQYVEPVIRKIAPPLYTVECSLIIKGVPESGIAPYLKTIAKKNPTAYIKSHPKGHELEKPVLDIRVLLSLPDKEQALSTARTIIGEIRSKASTLGGTIEREYCVIKS